MPELPEAETIARDLRRTVPGRRITDVEVTHADVLGPPLTAEELARRLRGRRVAEVGRRGKNLVLRFEDDARLMVNLGMTGRLVTSRSARAAELRHVAVRFALDDGSSLLYDDARRFGRIDLFETEAWPGRDAELGLEPLSDDFTADALRRLLRASRTPVRNFLLDQTKVAGVGNIYASEALFRAGVRPSRRAATLTRAEAERLRAGLREVLSEAIEQRGTTFSDYRDGSGEAGGFSFSLRVYGREGEPCVVCGGVVRRSVLTNRSAFWCRSCQR